MNKIERYPSNLPMSYQKQASSAIGIQIDSIIALLENIKQNMSIELMKLRRGRDLNS